jgi:hypothetical protein
MRTAVALVQREKLGFRRFLLADQTRCMSGAEDNRDQTQSDSMA